MNPKKQRITIAEACGLEVLHAAGKARAMVRQELCTGAASTDWKVMPDYLSDLNAMHEAEKVLTVDERFSYVRKLCRLLAVSSAEFAFIHATAAQRAEAFLRTLGLWKDDNTNI